MRDGDIVLVIHITALSIRGDGSFSLLRQGHTCQAFNLDFKSLAKVGNVVTQALGRALEVDGNGQKMSITRSADINRCIYCSYTMLCSTT